MATITVKGAASLSIKPDTIDLSIDTTTKRKDYAEALKRSDEKLSLPQQAVVRAGFKKDDLKILRFDVDSYYRESKHYDRKDEFAGYRCTQDF